MQCDCPAGHFVRFRDRRCLPCLTETTTAGAFVNQGFCPCEDPSAMTFNGETGACEGELVADAPVADALWDTNVVL